MADDAWPSFMKVPDDVSNQYGLEISALLPSLGVRSRYYLDRVPLGCYGFLAPWK